MPKKIIKIDSGIGGWGYTKTDLNWDLKGTEKDGVIIEISSLGGSAFDAIDMYNQIARHGNVEVVFIGPSASAATLLAMSAKKVSIVDNAFMLVHKVSTYVDAWGAYNVDDLDKLIEDLQTLRKENEKFDLVFARIYSKKSGKSIEETLDLMKKDTWITAQEAQEMGLVDEVITPATKYNFYTERFAARVRECDLPDFPQKSVVNTVTPADQQAQPEIQNQKSEINMNQFKTLNGLLEAEELQASDEGCYLNEEQLEIIEKRLQYIAGMEEKYNTALLDFEKKTEAALVERDAARISLSEMEKELTALRSGIALTTELHEAMSVQLKRLETENTNLTQEMDQLNRGLSEIDDTVASAEGFEAKISAMKALLSMTPGTPVPGALNQTITGTPINQVDWKTINDLPHNKEYDRNK